MCSVSKTSGTREVVQTFGSMLCVTGDSGLPLHSWWITYYILWKQDNIIMSRCHADQVISSRDRCKLLLAEEKFIQSRSVIFTRYGPHWNPHPTTSPSPPIEKTPCPFDKVCCIWYLLGEFGGLNFNESRSHSIHEALLVIERHSARSWKDNSESGKILADSKLSWIG